MKLIRNVCLLFFVLNLFDMSYAGYDLKKIYGLKDKNKLEIVKHEMEEEIGKNLQEKDNFKILGIVYHNLGVLSVRNAPEKAVECLEKATKLFPDDYEIVAYLGSAKTMVARDSWNVVIKVSSTNRGTNMIDIAVKKAPENIVVRMVRAINSLSLPEFFSRKHFAKEDFLYIETIIRKSSSDVDVDTKAEVFERLGLIYKSEGNAVLAKEYFKRAIDVSPNSEWGIKAKKEF